MEGKECQTFILITVAMFWVIAFVMDTPVGIVEGMIKIITSRDALITDYFELGGYGAAFFNAGLVTLIGTLFLLRE